MSPKLILFWISFYLNFYLAFSLNVKLRGSDSSQNEIPSQSPPSQFDQTSTSSILSSTSLSLSNSILTTTSSNGTGPSNSALPDELTGVKLAVTIALCIAGALCIVVAILSFFLARKRKKEKSLRLEIKEEKRKLKAESSQNVSTFDGISILKNLKILEEIGGGRFGNVYLASWEGSKVAAKKLNDSASGDLNSEFEKEATILFNLNHPNVVHFLGRYVDEQQQQYIVLEYMSKGSLKNVLQKEENNLKYTDLLEMIIGACRGMVFLSNRNILHRDLGVRNLLCSLVDGKYLVKISDFGLSRSLNRPRSFRGKSKKSKDDLYDSRLEMYSMKEGSNFPVKWSAPEVIIHDHCSTMSDVWSFGICMWEIMTFGAEPYSWLDMKQACEQIPQGKRLPRPSQLICPDSLWNLMQCCWDLKNTSRPSFKKLLEELETLSTEANDISVKIPIEESIKPIIEAPIAHGTPLMSALSKVDIPTSPYEQ